MKLVKATDYLHLRALYWELAQELPPGLQDIPAFHEMMGVIGSAAGCIQVTDKGYDFCQMMFSPHRKALFRAWVLRRTAHD